MSDKRYITFPAGKCDFDETTGKVTADRRPGHLYLEHRDGEPEILYLCWEPRSGAEPDSEPFEHIIGASDDNEYYFRRYSGSPTNGRIYVLNDGTNSNKTFFWLQSESQHPQRDPTWFSDLDSLRGQIVHGLITAQNMDSQLGEEKRLTEKLHSDRQNINNRDTTMTDAGDNSRDASGGAGADATGGDPREEGEESREGGADGGRAAVASSTTDTNTLVQNFLNSFKGSGGGQQQTETPFTSLPDLLASSTTIPVIDTADDTLIDSLVSHLPFQILLLAQGIEDTGKKESGSDAVQSAMAALSSGQKRDVLRKVLRSPQMHQSLGSLTMALRGGGLPDVSAALNIELHNGGRRQGMPLGGGEAVEAFLNGIKQAVENETKDATMDTS